MIEVVESCDFAFLLEKSLLNTLIINALDEMLLDFGTWTYHHYLLSFSLIMRYRSMFLTIVALLASNFRI